MDDGKRNEVEMDVVLGVASRREDFSRKGEGSGEGRAHYSTGLGGWRMTGSASPALDVFFQCRRQLFIRGESEGGGIVKCWA